MTDFCGDPATKQIGNLPVCEKCCHADEVFGIRAKKQKRGKP